MSSSLATEGLVSSRLVSVIYLFIFVYCLYVYLFILQRFFSLFWRYRTGDSRGFAFVRYKYADEAQKAVDRLDGLFLNFNFVHEILKSSLFLRKNLYLCIGFLIFFLIFFILGRVVDGREITVQFAKYGPNAEKM